MRGTAAGPARRWRSRRLARSPACSAGIQGGYLGHLTSSGTLANLEALWVAGQLAPGKRIVGSEQAHYTHRRISAVLKLDYAEIRADHCGPHVMEALETELRRAMWAQWWSRWAQRLWARWIRWTQILALREQYGFRVHVDAAYGGYFTLIADALDEPARRAYAAIAQADSIVIDPHKHGLQPYGCGCVLFRDPAVGRFYKHDSPYTYFTSKQLHLGEISLECSRAGAAAVALWATQQLLPLVPDGEFARGLAQGRRGGAGTGPPIARRRALPAARRRRAGAGYRGVETEGRDSGTEPRNWHRRSSMPAPRGTCTWLLYNCRCPGFRRLRPTRNQAESALVTCLRSVLMKPEHEAWLDRIWERLTAACADTIGK